MARAQAKITAREYLELERRADVRHEFYDGEIFAMAGASRAHSLIVANLVAALLPQAKTRGCELYPNDMRVRVPSTELYTYPDLVLVCGEPEFEDSEHDTLLNPVLIVEVLSPSTESYDRGEKFAHYRTIPSLVDYLLIDQQRLSVEHYVRHENGHWLFTAADQRGGAVTLVALEHRLELAEIYDGIADLAPSTARRP